MTEAPVDFSTLLPLKDVASKLHIHINTVRKAIKDNELQALKLGRGYKVTPEALQDFVNRQVVGAR